MRGSTTFLTAWLLCTLISRAFAVTRVPLMAYCPCSPTGRGFRKETQTFLSSGITRVVRSFNYLISIGTRRDLALGAAERIGVKILTSCVATYGWEACINADASFRGKKAYHYCTYIKENGRNIGFNRKTATDFVAPRCDSISGFASTPAQRGSSSDRGNSSSPPSSSSSGAPSPDSSSNNSSPPNSSKGSSSHGSSRKTPVDPSPSAVASPSSSSSSNPLKNPNSSPSGAGAGAGLGNIPSTDGGKTEGCVAVKHLAGFALQHRAHLWRPVLCAQGFCATPNHAIIVNGVYTSMKRLCVEGGWQCTSTSTWVNNLRVTANRRVNAVPGIVVTPYDIRFPKWTVWLAQLAVLAYEKAERIAETVSVVVIDWSRCRSP